MLRKLSDEIRYCYDHAEECLRKAQESVSQEQREAFAQIAKNWMNLARSYEFTERLTDFTTENRRRLDSLANSKLHQAASVGAGLFPRLVAGFDLERQSHTVLD